MTNIIELYSTNQMTLLVTVGPALWKIDFVWETWFQKGIRAQISAGDQK